MLEKNESKEAQGGAITSTKNILGEMANFTYTSKYARFNEEKQRREIWPETVGRVRDMHLKRFSYLNKENLEEIKDAFKMVEDKIIIPSMRSMQFGGKAIEAHNARIFNCSVIHIDSIRSFAESFYLLLAGCGVGFGLSEKYLSRLPNLVDTNDKTGTVITYVIDDTIEGWADSVEALLMCYFKNTPFTGRKIVFDYSKIRKEGSLLKTGGGKAPGHRGLKNAHAKIKKLLDYLIEEKGQYKLDTINAYDILMHEADAVLSGGIRRSATSVVFQKDDEKMAKAKTNFNVVKFGGFDKNDNGIYEGWVVVDGKYGGLKNVKYDVKLTEYEYLEMLKKEKVINWFHIEPQRARSNNSVLVLRDQVTFDEFKAIVEYTKQYGEPGFVFAEDEDTLYNPCFEIGFIPVTDDGRCGVQFCNLTSINGAKVKSIDDFSKAATAATIIGTLQAAYTSFPYLSNVAKLLTEEEALLGVSITGVMDNPDILLNPEYQFMVASLTKKVNEKWANIIGINQAARITCIKPEGTSSVVLESASGIHPHHARKYIRRIQMNKNDNVYKFFKKKNPHIVEESVWSANKTDDVISFPIEISENAITKDDLNAIQHLNYVKQTQENWVLTGTTNANKKNVRHNVSVTVEVNDHEWGEVIDYLYQQRKFFTAVSLLPKIGDNLYKQAPMQRIITEEDNKVWNELYEKFNHVDFSEFSESKDNTALQDTIACGANGCEIL